MFRGVISKIPTDCIKGQTPDSSWSLTWPNRALIKFLFFSPCPDAQISRSPFPPPQEYSALDYTWELCARQGEHRSKNTTQSSPLPLTRLLPGSQQLDPLQSSRHTNCEKLHFPQLSDDLVHWLPQKCPCNLSTPNPDLTQRFYWDPWVMSSNKDQEALLRRMMATWPCLPGLVLAWRTSTLKGREGELQGGRAGTSEGSAIGRGPWRLLKYWNVQFSPEWWGYRYFSLTTHMFYILFCMLDTFFNVKTPLPKRWNELVYLKPLISERAVLDIH